MTNVAGGDNLAAMDWEQFEHLVRELFEKEFAGKGSEVRVTRASRDGGVDAVIFDPDPIRGINLLSMLEKHGTHAHIDLPSARKLLESNG